ncbi:MAG: hypothetical protein D6712_05125 [Chloroflexi bacterium]|nr:MAG: hypothetical protein D6712_05125 [Chloroflexota bacterium]
MELGSWKFIILNLFFSSILLIFARFMLDLRRGAILWSYVLVSIVFVYLLPVQQYSEHVSLDIILLSHILYILYLIIVIIISRDYICHLEEIILITRNIPSGVMAGTICGWLALRFYLIAKYGAAALMFSRVQLTQGAGVVEFASWEVALSHITTLMLLGLFVTLTIQHAVRGGEGLGFFIIVTLIMLVVVVVTNESPIGSRRLVLVLAVLWSSVSWAYSGLPITGWIRKKRNIIILLTIIFSSLSIYYHKIRGNNYTELLEARGGGEFVRALSKFATTFETAEDGEMVHFLRSGPFDFFVRVVDTWISEDKSSGGAASAFSLAIAVPKALYPGEKPVGDVDEVLLERLEIVPPTPFLYIDYPTSLPAIGVADFGPVGVVMAAIVLGTSYILAGLFIKILSRNHFLFLIVLGLFIELIGSQEAGLTSILSSLRDSFVAIMFFLPLYLIFRNIKDRINSMNNQL